MTPNAVEQQPWIVVVGGFLGAGKTTLTLSAAREVERLGKRCAVIMNDQGSELVDTRLASLRGVPSEEVTGGCFCCRFSDLMDAAEQLRAFAPDVIFAEPVGSCADLIATVLRPLREYHQSYKIAPFTVVVDPQRATSLMRDDADPSLSFLFRKQIEEADLICFSKADLHPACPQLPASWLHHAPVRQMSASTGQGVSAWLNEILSGALLSSDHALEIDYQQYAQAEAALAWLNLSAIFTPAHPTAAIAAIGPFIDSLAIALAASSISIVHLKMIASSPTGSVKVAMCSNDEEPRAEGALDDSPSSKLDLLLNLRALGSPYQVREIVARELAQLDGRLEAVRLDCFSPAAPRPERRITDRP